MSEESKYNLGIYLMQFESLCHFNLMKHLVELFKTDEPKPIYGCESGLNAFVAMGYQLSASVFLYESIKHFAIGFTEESKVFTDHLYYKDLEVVRNNIHTYFKEGGFAKKTSYIMEEKLEEYKLIKPDIFYKLRSDISLVFQIGNNSRNLIGCDYFIYNSIYGSETGKWSGPYYRDYSTFLSSNIRELASTVDENQFHLSNLELREKKPIVELFDFKSTDMMDSSLVSPSSTFRLILMLYQISYTLFFIDEIFEYKIIDRDDLWYCFFIKLLAIKYDESFDNLRSLLKFSNEEDVKILHKSCEEENLIFENLVARDFAQKLRNTIHYQRILLDTDKIHGSSTDDIIKAIYFSNTGTDSMSDFRGKSEEMINEMRCLQRIIRKLISVDKNLTNKLYI